MRKRISIDSLIRQFLAAKQSLLNEKADIESQLERINDALAQASIPLDLERLPLGRTPESKLKARRKNVRGKLVPLTSTIDASVPHTPPGPDPVASENIVVFESSGFQPTSSRATAAVATSSEEQMIEDQGSSATLGGDAQEKPLRTMDRIALLCAVNKLIDENPEELPSFKSAGIPAITQRQLMEVKDLFPSPEDLDPEIARDTLMSLSLGNAVLGYQEIKDVILKLGIQTIGGMIKSLPQLGDLKKGQQILLFAKLARRLRLLPDDLGQTVDAETQFAGL